MNILQRRAINLAIDLLYSTSAHPVKLDPTYSREDLVGKILDSNNKQFTDAEKVRDAISWLKASIGEKED